MESGTKHVKLIYRFCTHSAIFVNTPPVLQRGGGAPEHFPGGQFLVTAERFEKVTAGKLLK